MKIVLTRVGERFYEDTVRLRQRILRDPLGLVLDTSMDSERVFFVALADDQKVIGTVALDGGRLKAMAIDPEVQGKGVGRRLVTCLEEEARTQGHRQIHLHARVTARDFYSKLGYQAEGDTFIEVTIPHIAMWKDLTW